MAGGRIGKDGVHGATFSSESLSDNSPAHAVQIGDPFTQKRLLDFVLEARDQGLITGLTDNGAGGLSSSIGEMATITNGATIELENIPLKYPGLSDWEIVVSESQERMSLSTRDFAAMAELAKKYNVEVTDIGEFRNDGFFRVMRGGKTIALLDLEFLHKGVPKLQTKISLCGSPCYSQGRCRTFTGGGQCRQQGDLACNFWLIQIFAVGKKSSAATTMKCRVAASLSHSWVRIKMHLAIVR